MKVELKDLRWAVVAAQHRSLRQAAVALNVRQSTLSRNLRDLEHRLGATLFERTTGGTRPTAAGKEFVEAARRIIAEMEATFERLKTRSRGESGRLAIGVCAALSAGNLRATLIEYRKRFPEVEIEVVDGARLRLLSDLSVGAIDIAVMTPGVSVWEDRSLRLWSERAVLAVPDDHPLNARAEIHWADLEGERLLVTSRDPGPDLQQLLETRLGSNDRCKSMPHRVTLDHLLGLVSAGLGPTIIVEGATGATYRGVSYREVTDAGGPTHLDFAAYWREANDNPTLAPFLDLLRERYPDLRGSAAGAGGVGGDPDD